MTAKDKKNEGKTSQGKSDQRRSTEELHDLSQLQFPALTGAPEVEIAKRTQDNDGVLVDDRFHKTFVALPQQDIENAAQLLEKDAKVHEANKLGVLDQAIQQGLHPDGEASFDGADQHEDGVSLCLKYSVPVTPASVDHEAASAVTPRRVLTERLDGSTSNAKAKAGETEVSRDLPKPTE